MAFQKFSPALTSQIITPQIAAMTTQPIRAAVPFTPRRNERKNMKSRRASSWFSAPSMRRPESASSSRNTLRNCSSCSLVKPSIYNAFTVERSQSFLAICRAPCAWCWSDRRQGRTPSGGRLLLDAADNLVHEIAAKNNVKDGPKVRGKVVSDTPAQQLVPKHQLPQIEDERQGETDTDPAFHRVGLCGQDD